MTIREWQDLSLAYAQSKGFDLSKTTDGDKLMLIVSEAAEALEAVRNNEPHIHFGPNGKPEGLGPELADIVLRTIQYAAHLGIDIEEMMELKHAYNETRPPKHGGKAF